MSRRDDEKRGFLGRVKDVMDGQVAAHNPVSPRVLAKLAAFKRREGLGADAAEVKENIALSRKDEFKSLMGIFPPKSRNRRLALIGMRLRDSHADSDEVERLLSRVFSAYGVSGRRAAQAVECGGVRLLIEELRRSLAPHEAVVAFVNDFMEKIDSCSYFIQQQETADAVTARIQSALNRPQNKFYLASGSGRAAQIVETVGNALEAANGDTHVVHRHQELGDFNAMLLLVRR